MKYVALRCRCGQRTCTSWYVGLEEEPTIKVSAFSERQVGVVVNSLNALDDYPDGTNHTDHTDMHTDRGGG